MIELICELPLSNSSLKTIIDAKYYYHLINVSRWYIDSNGYIRSSWAFCNNKPQVYLHRYIMLLQNRIQDELQVDHIDRNKLNNTSSNLRMVTHQENCRNVGKRGGSSSQYIGVSWDKQHKKWRAQIKNKNVILLGLYDSETEAAQVYDEALANILSNEEVKVYNFPE